MPFGLTNATISFQALMNQVFAPYLRKVILVFFDNILIYSLDFPAHVNHFTIAQLLLRENTLYAKLSKCSFAQPQVEYLGHIISVEGVSADLSKIDCILKWPKPKTVKALRGFLGLTDYYKKFIKGYGK